MPAAGGIGPEGIDLARSAGGREDVLADSGALARVDRQHVAIGEFDAAVRVACETFPLYQAVPAPLGSENQAICLYLRDLENSAIAANVAARIGIEKAGIGALEEADPVALGKRQIIFPGIGPSPTRR